MGTSRASVTGQSLLALANDNRDCGSRHKVMARTLPLRQADGTDNQ